MDEIILNKNSIGETSVTLNINRYYCKFCGKPLYRVIIRSPLMKNFRLRSSDFPQRDTFGTAKANLSTEMVVVIKNILLEETPEYLHHKMMYRR
ncbi:MAG: hypothetical protein IEMM0006_0193 [bacterium]|nr:MAG: hypothetical protein IEMM0006_0193 [bacterium]